MAKMSRQQAYRLLDLAPGAEDAQIEMAFKRLARSAHPDFGGSGASFDRLVRARELLLQEPQTTASVIVVRGRWWRRWLRRRRQSRLRNLQ